MKPFALFHSHANWENSHDVGRQSELTQGTASQPEVLPCSSKGLFPACVGPHPHLVEWARDIVHLSNFAAAHTVHSVGCRLQVTSQFASLNTSVFTRETANHAEMLSKEHILSLPFQDDKSPE